MWRAIAWSSIVLCALLAHFLDYNAARDACVLGTLVLIAASAPSALRAPSLLIVAAAVAAILYGYDEKLFDAIPAIVAGIIAWLFARTLITSRVPLIGRAIAAMDGAEQLQDPATARYARHLTAVWAIYQGMLAAFAFALALHAWSRVPWWPFLPGPRVFGAVVLPVAVAALLAVEFVLRPYLLPQAPRRGAFNFVYGLVRVWPQLLQD